MTGTVVPAKRRPSKYDFVSTKLRGLIVKSCHTAFDFVNSPTHIKTIRGSTGVSGNGSFEHNCSRIEPTKAVDAPVKRICNEATAPALVSDSSETSLLKLMYQTFLNIVKRSCCYNQRDRYTWGYLHPILAPAVSRIISFRMRTYPSQSLTGLWCRYRLAWCRQTWLRNYGNVCILCGSSCVVESIPIVRCSCRRSRVVKGPFSCIASGWFTTEWGYGNTCGWYDTYRSLLNPIAYVKGRCCTFCGNCEHVSGTIIGT